VLILTGIRYNEIYLFFNVFTLSLKNPCYDFGGRLSQDLGACERRSQASHATDESPPIKEKTHAYARIFSFIGGDEGCRTPVRKSKNKTFYECSFVMIIPFDFVHKQT